MHSLYSYNAILYSLFSSTEFTIETTIFYYLFDEKRIFCAVRFFSAFHAIQKLLDPEAAVLFLSVKYTNTIEYGISTRLIRRFSGLLTNAYANNQIENIVNAGIS